MLWITFAQFLIICWVFNQTDNSNNTIITNNENNLPNKNFKNIYLILKMDDNPLFF